MIILYNILLFMVFFLVLPFVPLLMLISDKRRHTLPKRLFMLNHNLCDASFESSGKPIWVHALSVGETLSAKPLVQRLYSKFGKNRILFTASTKTGFEIAKREMKNQVCAVCYFPYDFLFSVKRALKIINPERVIIVETDLWPNFLFELQKRQIPAYLVNARLSRKSFDGYGRFKGFMGRVLNIFQKILAQTQDDATRFEKLGAAPAVVKPVGNFKFDQDTIAVSGNTAARLKSRLGIPPDRKIFIAGSTHTGEEKMLAGVLKEIRSDGLNPVVISVPRNPDRGDEVHRIFSTHDFSAIKMSQMDPLQDHKNAYDVLVVDAIGHLAALYTLADVAFVGGSLVRKGGHNPLEPAAMAKPVIFGRHMDDFKEIALLLVEKGGAQYVTDEKDMDIILNKLLSDEDFADLMGKNAESVFEENKGAVEKTITEIFDDESIIIK